MKQRFTGQSNLIRKLGLLFHGLILLHLDEKKLGATSLDVIFLISEILIINSDATLTACTGFHEQIRRAAPITIARERGSSSHRLLPFQPRRWAKRYRHCREVSSSNALHSSRKRKISLCSSSTVGLVIDVWKFFC